MTGNATMQEIEYPRMFEAEDDHWWYLGMQAITRAILDRRVPRDPGQQILDAGCGTGGAMANYLGDYGIVTGFDISRLALDFCKQRRLHRLAQASADAIPFAAASFNIVACFDVIYMLNGTAKAVQEFERVLKPGGHLLLRVAANDWLRGKHDLAVRTVHRFSAKEVEGLLRGAGLRPLHSSYVNTFLFPLAVAKRLLEDILEPAAHSSDLSRMPRAIEALLRRILAGEARIASRARLPFGLSVFALARKPDGEKSVRVAGVNSPPS